VVLARALCGDAVVRTAADVNRFRFEDVTTVSDEMMLPGALKYGGLPAFAALCAPGDLFLHNMPSPGAQEPDWVGGAYRAAGAGVYQRESEQAAPEKVVGWLLR
jgi:hypothetical protein